MNIEITLEDYNDYICEMIHIESVYKTLLDEVKLVSESTNDEIAAKRLKNAIDFIYKENCSPDDLKTFRKSIIE